MNMLIQVVCVVIRASQTTFLKGRYILEGVVTMHETLNEIHREKSLRVLFKIDFEKAFDKVKWSFLLQVLEMKGFPPIWNDWMLKAVRGGRVAIKVNEEVAEIQFGSHVRMLPMPKNYISECQKNQTKNFTCTSS
jgi:hypothetical protein